MSEKTGGHTPGPWRAAIENDAERLPGEDKNELACLPHAAFDAVDILAPKRADVCPHSNSWDEFEANARLIAAAPCMLEALERIEELTHLSDNEGVMNVCAIAREAIAKARCRREP